MGADEMAEEDFSLAFDFYLLGLPELALSILNRESVSSNLSLKRERAHLINRCKLMSNGFTTFEAQQLAQSSVAEEKSVALMYQYMQQRSDKQRNSLKELINVSADNTAKYNAAAAALQEGDALEALHNISGDSLEMLALKIQTLVAIHRCDLAEEELNKMTVTNEASMVTKLMSAWLLLESGNYQEAYFTLDDVLILIRQRVGQSSDQTSSIVLHNAMAVANMQRQLWSEVKEDMQVCLNATNNDPCALSNAITYYRRIRQHEKAENCLQKLSQVDPNNHIFGVKKKLDDTIEKMQKLATSTSP